MLDLIHVGERGSSQGLFLPWYHICGNDDRNMA
jgi:hypothetical protein